MVMNGRKKRNYLLIFWLLIYSLFFLKSLPLQAAGIQVNTSLGFQEYVVPGRWNPLMVEVKGGDLTKPEKLTIEVAKVNAFDEDIERFPELYFMEISGGISGLQIPVFIQESGSIIYLSIRSGSRLLIEERIDSRAKVFPGHVILTSGIASTMQQAISRSLLPREPVNTIDTALEDLPVQGLNYDGVSAMVIADQGPVLSPAQVCAIRSWLAGGGTLVIGNPLPESEGILSHFIKERITEAMTPSLSRLGLGRIIRLPLSLSKEDPAYWRSLLSLDHYVDAKRLTAGQVFPEKVIPKPDALGVEEKGKPELRLLLIGWFLLNLALLRLPKSIQGRARLLAFSTLICILLSLPLGRWGMNLWRRGVPVHTEALLLPAGGGIIFNNGIGLTEESSFSFRVKLGESEEGRINLWENDRLWKHLLPTPIGVLQTGSERELNITGILPVERVDFEGNFWNSISALAPSGQIGVYDGEIWRELQLDQTGQADWQIKRGGAPDWVRNLELIRGLQRLFPEYNWVFGLSPLSGFSFKVQDKLCNDIYWVTPVKKGVEL